MSQPDWRLPPGVNRPLWDAFHNAEVAAGYDELLQGTPLLEFDRDTVRRWIAPGRSIIDLGAGTGRLTIDLAEKARLAVAVDLSPEMLRALDEKAKRAHRPVQCVQANIVELGCFADASFDAALCMFSTLGLIVGKKNREKAVREAARLLAPGGTYIVHVHNFRRHWWSSGGRALLWKQWRETRSGRAEAGDFVMPPHHGSGRLTMHLFTLAEIRGLLESAGLRVAETCFVNADGSGPLTSPWLLPSWRAMGFIVKAVKA